MLQKNSWNKIDSENTYWNEERTGKRADRFELDLTRCSRMSFQTGRLIRISIRWWMFTWCSNNNRTHTTCNEERHSCIIGHKRWTCFVLSRGNRGNKQEQNSLRLQLAAEKRKMGGFSTPEAQMGRSMGVPPNSWDSFVQRLLSHTDVSGHDNGHYITGAGGRNVDGGDSGSAHQRSSGALESSCVSILNFAPTFTITYLTLKQTPTHTETDTHTRFARNPHTHSSQPRFASGIYSWKKY